jgi:hypothetical protein
MTAMKIELSVVQPSPVDGPYPGPGHPGSVIYVFTNDLEFKSIDGVPLNKPKAGTHSGTITFFREAKKGDRSLAEGVRLLEYEATFALIAVTYGGKQHDAGQVTAQGVFYMNKNYQSVDPWGQLDAQGQPVEKRFAVTGGTGPYFHARGHAFETGDGLDKRLDIDL